MTRLRSVGARGPLAIALALGLFGAACTDDSPQTDLPCEFYFTQRDSGVDVEIPEECEGQDPAEAPGETTATTGVGDLPGE